MVWFKDAVISGLQMLMALRLRNSPSAETMQALTKVWLTALSTRPIEWDEKLDLPRLKKAFTELAARSTHWPAPADLIAAMPPRANQFKLEYKAKSTMTPETRKLLDGLKVRLKA
jgi:phosphomannomutase